MMTGPGMHRGSGGGTGGEGIADTWYDVVDRIGQLSEQRQTGRRDSNCVLTF